MIAARAVILAAGTSSRIGRQKLLMEFRGRKLIEYPIAAAQMWNPIVVAGPDVARYLAARSDVEVLLNDEPERGMSHSLGLGNRAVVDELALIVLLGDKPLITAALIEFVCRAAADADLVYPVCEDVPGHPVWLSPRARACIDGLPDGDTLRLLRDRLELRQRAVKTSDAGAVFDLDTTSAFEESRSRGMMRRAKGSHSACTRHRQSIRRRR
jgi:molybdenum cofactor cytidylyltransferase